jgi:hypothetical protein
LYIMNRFTNHYFQTQALLPSLSYKALRMALSKKTPPAPNPTQIKVHWLVNSERLGQNEFFSSTNASKSASFSGWDSYRLAWLASFSLSPPMYRRKAQLVSGDKSERGLNKLLAYRKSG